MNTAITDTATTEPPVKKRTKPQGKLDRNIIFKLLTQKNPPSKQVIAKEAGSLASSPVTRSNAVAQVEKSSEMQLRLEEHYNSQNQRALKWIKKAEENIDMEEFRKDPAKLASFKMANEKILQENLNRGIQREVEKVGNKGGVDNKTSKELEDEVAKGRAQIATLERIVNNEKIQEGEIVVE